MQLRAHEGQAEGEKGFSECTLRFHFMFDMLIAEERRYLAMFEWDINSAP